MKFNLKNRPKTYDYHPQLGKFTIANDIWFRGFEKELREAHKEYKDDPHDYPLSVIADFIDGILGETT